MNRREFENRIIDYLEDALAAGDRERFERAMNEQAELRKLFDEYREVCGVAKALGSERFEIGAGFEVKVMDRIAEVRPGVVERFRMALPSQFRYFAGTVATVATLVLILKMGSETSEDTLKHVARPVPQSAVPASGETQTSSSPAAASNSGTAPIPGVAPAPGATLVPPLNSAGSGTKSPEPQPPPPVSALSVAEGKRAVTLALEGPSGVEGHAAPGAKVDMIWTYTDQSGRKRSAVIARDAAVLSTGASVSAEKKGQAPSGSSATVMLSEKDAKKFELARSIGTVSLSLRGEQDSQPNTDSSITVSDLVATPSHSAPSAEPESRNRSTAGRPAELLKDLPILKSPRYVTDELNPTHSGVTFAPKPMGPAVAMSMPEQRADGDPGLWRLQSPPPPDQQREQYVPYEESPRTPTLQEPMTTFGVDVDTASYANTRRFLSLGQLPPPESVRIEELLNYFNYDYPSERERPFGVSYEIAPSPFEPGRHLLRFAIKSRELKEAVKPWNLVFLVDVSGSMSDRNKLELVKSGLRALVGKMRPSDKVAIVTYAGDTRVALESTSVQERDRIIAAIDSLHPGGSTNGEGGIKKAYDIANANRINGGVNRVILATDGDFNVGVTSHNALVTMIEEKRRSGISLTTLGVGTGNIHDGMLEQLANKGNGNYFYLDTVQEARRVLEENVFGTMEIVAKDVKLQVEFNPAAVAQYRLIGYDNRRLENHQFNDDSVDSGEIGSGHAVTALYEVTLVDSPLAKDTEYRYRVAEPKPEVKTESAFADELGFLKIRFKAPDGDRSELLEFPLTRASIRAQVEDSTNDFRFAAAVSYFGHLLRKSKFSGSYTFAQIAELAEKSRGADTDGKRREFVELVRNAAVGR